jgi:hypothetical protein
MMLRVAAFALAASPTFAQIFFPPGVLPDTSAIRYTQFLQVLHEPSLFELGTRDPNAEAYRLLWLRDNDRPASIRFVIKPSGRGGSTGGWRVVRAQHSRLACARTECPGPGNRARRLF